MVSALTRSISISVFYTIIERKNMLGERLVDWFDYMLLNHESWFKPLVAGTCGSLAGFGAGALALLILITFH
jgi:hypothetical protein